MTAAALVAITVGCAGEQPPVPAARVRDAGFVGRERCSACHVAESDAWQGSHHDRAMQEATDSTVLGDFNDARARYDGREVRFVRAGGEFHIRVGPQGTATEYRVDYTFGAEPLQQYLIEFPGGRLQPFGMAWDARPAADGGQRWFDLYPDDQLSPGDELHWTGLQQNWNYVCAECHSTGLRKNYDRQQDRYNTVWAEIDVSCEACHGPGSGHVDWADRGARNEDVSTVLGKGLVFDLGDRAREATWTIDPTTGLASREPALATRSEIETCARCHSRRATQTADYRFGRPLGDTHRVALLDERLYHPDGQIRDEVYVYGSFLQSRMYANGVTCSDCHEPHSGQLYAEGNALCNRCHLAQKFDTAEHHFHDSDSAGAQCVECHMPSQTYMQIDDRRDHSIRVPRPDLTARIGTPNACAACHANRSSAWVQERFARWYGDDLPGHYGEAIAAARAGSREAAVGLVELANDWNQPGIARATAMSLLEQYPSAEGLDALRRGLNNDDPLIRGAALQSLRGADPQLQLTLALPALRDKVLSVRLAATRVLSRLPLDQLPEPPRQAILAGVGELIATLEANADRPEALISLGAVYAQTGRPADAEASYRRALELEPRRITGYVNLADLYRALARDAEGEVLLRQALGLEPANADVHHALGLLLVRRNRYVDAIDALGQAWRLGPETPRYALAYALALRQTGDLAGATQVLNTAIERTPRSVELLNGLVTASREAGRLDLALGYARRMAAVAPQDASILQLVRDLEGSQ